MAQLKSAADGKALVDAMKAMPTDDPLFGKGSIRADGRHIHPVYLMQVKTPAESKGEWDVFKMVVDRAAGRRLPPARQGRLPVREELRRSGRRAICDAKCRRDRHRRPGRPGLPRRRACNDGG